MSGALPFQVTTSVTKDNVKTLAVVGGNQIILFELNKGAQQRASTSVEAVIRNSTE
jgi:hypothetical protein